MSTTSYSLTPNNTVQLLKSGYDNTIASYCKVYALRLYDSSKILVRNMIPAIRNSDNKPGMYDTVTGAFYTNAGSGEFSVGPTITCNIINNGATVDNNGKIGKCYSFNGGTITAPAPKITNKITVAAWIKAPDNNGGWRRVCGMQSAAISWQSASALLMLNGTNLYFSISNGSTCTSGGCVFDIGDSSNWFHACGTYDGTTARLYVNGVLKKEFAIATTIENTPIWLGGTSAGERFTGKLNDFRLYDECLSAEEIKEISRGMVLHYKMCQPERSENLLSGTNNEEVSDSKWWKNLGSGADISLDKTGPTEVKWTCVTPSPQWNCLHRNLTLSKLSNTGTYTLSLEVKSSSGGSLRCQLTKSNGLNSLGLFGNWTLPANKWTKIVGTVTLNGGAWDSQQLYFSGSVLTTANSNCLFKNIKLETGANPNPQWSPAPSDNPNWGTIEYDGSGFKNHGIITAASAPTWSNDTKRYNGSYLFNGSQYIRSNNKFIIGTGDLTVSAWIKLINCNDSYQHILSCKNTAANSAGFSCNYNGSQQKFMWQFCDGGTTMEIWTADTFPKSDIVGKWVHVVMVRNASDSRKGYFYINGARKELTSVPTILNITSNANNLAIGACGDVDYSTYRWNGNISDVRIYSTALSQEDITNLYKLGKEWLYKFDYMEKILLTKVSVQIMLRGLVLLLMLMVN